MHRAGLLNLLQAYQPKDSQEIIFKQDIIQFVEQYFNCFERSLEIGHITGSCWLLNKDGSKALIMHHAKLNQWFQLGGHCDGNSDVLLVALKEAQEESGMQHIVPVSTDVFDIDVHLIPANKKEKEHFHYDIRFLLQVTSDEEVVANAESKELRWITKERALLPTNAVSMIRMFNKWREL